MLKKSKKTVSVLLFMLFVVLTLPQFCYANSAEPPSIIVLVNQAPEDLSVMLISEGKEYTPQVRSVAWEHYYLFYNSELGTGHKQRLKISTGQGSFEYEFPQSITSYNNVYTLDLDKRTLVEGEYPLRTFILVGIRVLLTLLLEGLVFYFMGYRTKQSWLIFLIINLLTQGWLNSILSGGSVIQGYVVLTLIAVEIIVFIIEMIFMPLLIKEKKKYITFIYVLIANSVSLMLGYLLIQKLPI